MLAQSSEFCTGVVNMGGSCATPTPIGGVAPQNLMEGVLSGGGQNMRRAWGELKMLSKDTCEGVHLIVKLPAISLKACKFTKNELLHTYFSRILARF